MKKLIQNSLFASLFLLSLNLLARNYSSLEVTIILESREFSTLTAAFDSAEDTVDLTQNHINTMTNYLEAEGDDELTATEREQLDALITAAGLDLDAEMAGAEAVGAEAVEVVLGDILPVPPETFEALAGFAVDPAVTAVLEAYGALPGGPAAPAAVGNSWTDFDAGSGRK